MNKIARDLVIFGIGSFLFLDLPVFIQLLTGLKTEPINFPDILDLILFAPFYMIMLFRIYRDLNAETSSGGTIGTYLFTFLYALHFEGHGLHWAANAVDLLQHCVDKNACLASYGESASAQELAYFLDEVLGHKLMFYPLLAILFLFLLWDKKTELDHRERLFLIISGVIYGFVLIVATVEGQTGYEGLFFAIVVISYVIYQLFSSSKNISEILDKPVTLFLYVVALTMLIIGLAWWAYWGTLIEPSKVFGF